MYQKILGPISISEKENDLVKYRSRGIGSLNNGIALKCDRHIGRTDLDVPVKRQSDRTTLSTNLVVSMLCVI